MSARSSRWTPSRTRRAAPAADPGRPARRAPTACGPGCRRCRSPGRARGRPTPAPTPASSPGPASGAGRTGAAPATAARRGRAPAPRPGGAGRTAPRPPPPRRGRPDRPRCRPRAGTAGQRLVAARTDADTLGRMPRLKDRLQGDLTTAMKARDELRASTLRMVLTAVRNEEVAGKTARELDDAEVVTVLTREAKKRREAADAFTEGGRADRAEREQAAGTAS